MRRNIILCIQAVLLLGEIVPCWTPNNIQYNGVPFGFFSLKPPRMVACLHAQQTKTTPFAWGPQRCGHEGTPPTRLGRLGLSGNMFLGWGGGDETAIPLWCGRFTILRQALELVNVSGLVASAPLPEKSCVPSSLLRNFAMPACLSHLARVAGFRLSRASLRGLVPIIPVGHSTAPTRIICLTTIPTIGQPATNMISAECCFGVP